MGLHRCVIRLRDGRNFEEVRKIIEEDGGKILPSPLIFPPMQNCDIPEGTIAKLKNVDGVEDVDDHGD
ncbi:hypothetical protein BGZ46_008842, partial [Entomortierella lignicola]